MRILPVRLTLVIWAAALGSAAGLPAPAQSEESGATEFEPLPVIRGAEVGAPVTPFVFDGDVRDLPAPVRWRPGDAVREIPRRFYPAPGSESQYESHSVPFVDLLHLRQLEAGDNTTLAFTTPSRNFPGIGFTGVNPPDTVGDVGPNHYIQMVNSGGGAQVRIYDKAEPTPAQLASFTLDSLGSGACANGFGDPIVLYDRLADRWLLSEFSGSGNNLCVYISQTGNPVSGGWFNYGFTAPSFPDYPKYAVWPTDANGGAGSYVVTANDGGPGIYALNRGAMLAGTASTFQRLTIPGLPGFGFEAPIAADLDGPTPPAAQAPALILRHRDTENHSGPAVAGDVLEGWAFSVNWVTPASTTLTQLPNVITSEFDSDLCGLTSFFCFPQPGTGTTLDPLREVIMNRLQYMNHGDHESLVGNLVTDVNGANRGGIRWFELRRSGGGGWTLFQEGTYSPNTDSRWMAASAMDQSGNIAVAYSVSSSTTFPSLRYTGRLATDPAGVMTQAETSIHAGTASNSSNRWGDYAAMNLDPADDCTFWFTSLDNTTSSWRTQIASFGFDACGCALLPTPPLAFAATNGANRIDVDWDDSDLPTVVEYRVRRSLTPGGPYETIGTLADTSPGFAGGAGYSFSDSNVSGGSTYYYIVISSDGSACTSDPSGEVSATATGVCTLPPLFDGVQSVSTPFLGNCTLDVAWNAGTARCGGPLAYDVYRSTDDGFLPGPATLLAAGVGATALSDTNVLVDSETYYYVVRAVDTAIATDDGNTVQRSGRPQGTLTSGTWSDDAGDSDTAKLLPSAPWSVNATEGNLGPKVYKTGSYGNLLCAGLRTPLLQLGTGSQLSFASRYAMENSYDKGEVQISTDGGTVWTRVPMTYPGTSTHASDNCGLPTGTYFTGTNNSWQTYVANLSAWSGQAVRLRFVLSTDGSVNGAGWWIDDISITNVDVPGVCATGSSCADNPLVDVTPDGPLTVCVGEAQELTAALVGGNGPFEFQWTEDGVDLLGETAAGLTIDRSGTHTYNADVRATGCPDRVRDGIATSITWVDRPFFDGIVAADNTQNATCGVNLDWEPADSVCPGTVTYSVYRATSPGVPATPANRIAAGVIGSGYVDTGGLSSGTTYHYLVRAVQSLTGQDDGNSVEAAAAPAGPGGGPQILFSDDFENAATFAAWSVTTGPGPHTCGAWARSDGAAQRPGGGAGFYGLSNSDACGASSTTSTTLTSPVIDADLPGISAVTLDLELFYRHYNGDDASISVWDGAAWQVVWSDLNATLNTHLTLDVTAYAAGNSAFRVRFDYQNAAFDWWFAVDNLVLTALVDNPCSTAPQGPAPAPDGRNGTSPLRGERLDPDGSAVRVTWDVSSCLASGGYNLIYGALGDVASYALGGSVCGIGLAGSYDWSGVPAGDLYFLVVGTDGNGVESSWGSDSGGAERNGASASGECSLTLKDPGGTCP